MPCIYFFCNHIVSIVGPLRTLELQCLGPDRIIYRTYSAKENSFNEFMKCLRYVLIVKAQEFSLEVSMGRLFEGRVNLAILWGTLPLPIVFRTVRMPCKWFHKGLRCCLSLFHYLFVFLVRYWLVYKKYCIILFSPLYLGHQLMRIHS